MNMRTYVATVRKLHAAYVALAAAAESATQGYEPMFAAMDAMRRVPDAMLVQVCRKCNERGYFTKPGDLYTAWGCQHEDVPRYDVRTGEQIPLNA